MAMDNPQAIYPSGDRMTFLAKLDALRQAATKGPFEVEHDELVSVIREQQQGFTHVPCCVAESYDDQRKGCMEYLCFLANHADALAELVQKTDKLIAYIGAHGEIGRNKINEIELIDDVLNALDALDKEQKK